MARIKSDSHLYKPLKYVDILTDYGFKLLFGDRELLMAFLNALFEESGKVVTSVRYLNKEILAVNRRGRTIYYDILCKIDGEEDVIIEMQFRSQDTYIERSFYYMAQSIMHQGDSNKRWTYRVYPVYGIFLMNFHLPIKDAPDQVVYEVVPTIKGTDKVLTEKFRMFFIDLLNFTKTDEDDLSSMLECWIYSIKNMGKITTAPKLANKTPFTRLYTRAEIANMNPRQYREYERSLKIYRDAYSIEQTERNERKRERAEARAEGLAEGRAEGVIQGRAEGRAEGVIQGRAEGMEEGMVVGEKQAKLLIARSLKSLGKMTIEEIAAATNLTPDEVEKS